jgi:hypothetical protein
VPLGIPITEKERLAQQMGVSPQELEYMGRWEPRRNAAQKAAKFLKDAALIAGTGALAYQGYKALQDGRNQPSSDPTGGVSGASSSPEPVITRREAIQRGEKADIASDIEKFGSSVMSPVDSAKPSGDQAVRQQLLSKAAVNREKGGPLARRTNRGSAIASTPSRAVTAPVDSSSELSTADNEYVKYGSVGLPIAARNKNRPGLTEGLYTGLRAENPLTTGTLATAVTPDGRPIRALGGGGGALTFPAQYQTPFQRMAYGGPFGLSTKAAMTPRFWEMGGGAPPGWASGLGGTLGHAAEGVIGLVQPELIPVLGAGEFIGNVVSHIPQIAGAGASMGVRALEQGTIAGLTAAERAVTDALNVASIAVPTAKAAGQLTRRAGDRVFDLGQSTRRIHDQYIVPPVRGAARQLGQWDTEGRYLYDQVAPQLFARAAADYERGIIKPAVGSMRNAQKAALNEVVQKFLPDGSRHPDLPPGEDDEWRRNPNWPWGS